MIYLDNAATTYPKPKSVCDETLSYIKNCGGNPGRGSHERSIAAAKTVFEARELLSSFFGLGSPESVIFTLNTTHALNTVIKGFLRQGDHVLISDLEHNSVYRPIYALACEGKIKFSIFHSFANRKHSDDEIIADIESKITSRTKMLICTHASNICSQIMPIKRIGELCKRRSIFFCVDGAQSAGHIDIDMKAANISALCVPGHKGLYGPQGCGAILLSEGVNLKTLTEGGNGVNSLDGKMPEESPERYETGTLPMPAKAGHRAAEQEIIKLTPEKIHAHESSLFLYAKESLERLGAVIYSPHTAGSVLLFSFDGVSQDTIGESLSRDGICVRTGYHCAPLAHKALKTPEGGAVRVSFGIYNTLADIDALTSAVKTAIK